MQKNSEVELQKEYIKKVYNRNEELKAKENVKILTYHIQTMGCKLNENDSEKLAGMLEEMGYVRVDEIEEANFIIFNTCCIRENAEEKLFGKLGAVKKLKEKPNTYVAICGCMMQEEHIVKKIKSSYRYVDIVFGTHTLHKLPQDILEVMDTNKRIEDVEDISGYIYENIPIKRENESQANIAIMNGCNNFCAFCIVPYVRGRERSRMPKDILEEAEGLAKAGYKEITLLGQNVNSYLRSEREKNIEFEEYRGVNSFATLLRQLNEISGIELIKFISPHPKDFTDDVIAAIKECKNVSKQVHLPLQSGSTAVLKEMNRRYTKEHFLGLVEKMKKEIAGLSLSTDIIVGFPGETEEDFNDTLDVIREVKFEQVFMFIYSRRIGTRADKMENQIDETVKHERFERLKQLVTDMTQEDNEKYIGTIQSILVEGPSKNNKEMLAGRTMTNKVVIFESQDESLINKIVDIKIITNNLWFLKGELVEK